MQQLVEISESNHGGLYIISVSRIHNPNLWSEYNNTKATIRDIVLTSSELISFKTTNPNLPPSHLPRLESEINEGYLFHVFPFDHLEVLRRDGFQVKQTEGTFGTGCYFTEDLKKAGQHLDCNDEHVYVLLSRVCMGRSFTTTHEFPGLTIPRDYHSILAQKGDQKVRTFIVPEAQAYPEFLLIVTRKISDKPEASKWTVGATYDWASTILPLEQAEILRNQLVDGQALLLLTRDLIMGCGIPERDAKTLEIAIFQLKSPGIFDKETERICYEADVLEVLGGPDGKTIIDEVPAIRVCPNEACLRLVQKRDHESRHVLCVACGLKFCFVCLGGCTCCSKVLGNHTCKHSSDCCGNQIAVCQTVTHPLTYLVKPRLN